MPRVLKALGPDEGEALWAAGSLMIVKATADDTGGGVTITEDVYSADFDSSEHVHPNEEQCLYMLAGSVELACGDDRRSLTPGCFAVLPRGVPHSFVVGSDGARFLSLTTPGGFEKLARAIGTPAAELTPPPDPAANMALAVQRFAEGAVG